MIHKVALQGAAKAAILHCYHLVSLHQGRLINQALVNVEGGHVVDDDRTPEVLLLMLGLKDVLEQSGLAGTEEAAEQRHWQQVIC